MDRKVIIRYSIRELMGLVVMGVALFWAAGRIDWWPAWAALGVMAAWIIATAAVILRFHPELLAERLGPRKGAKRWDTAIMSLVGLLQLARYIAAGLDERHGLTAGIPVVAQIAALLVCLLSYALVTWATGENAWFSQIVRVQTEREQIVVTTGPYHFVRHPAYLGAVLYELAVPILLASWWAMLISLLSTALLIVRTCLEDKTLQKELPGYSEFSRTVRFRLIPGIW